MEIPAQVGRKPIDVATQFEQRVLGRAARERPDGDADRLGLGPPALAGPCLELLEIPLVKVDLQRSRHDLPSYRIMIQMSIGS